MNELKRLDEFRKVLSDYKISPDTQTVLKRTPFVAMAAITSSGRNTVMRELDKTGKYHYVVSDTTRKPRINDGVHETNGVEYWFKTEDQFLAGLQGGRYLEAAIIHSQQVSGISIDELERAEKEHKIAITDMEVQGVETIARHKPDLTAIFLLPPSYDEWQRRLHKRGHMSDEEYANRMDSARAELKIALASPLYHYVVNDELETTVYVVDKIAHGHESARHAAEARSVAEEILARLSS